MKKEHVDAFVESWNRYFDGAELPVTFYYTDEEGHAEQVKPGTGARCVIGALSKVRKGRPLCFNTASVACPGGKRYLGFTRSIMPDFEYFLSCGIPGRLEGERYKKSPDLVNKYMEHLPQFEAPGRMIVFKRWDSLEESDNPEVAIFFATPDVLSGLFTLANFDEAGPDAVFTPWGSGCSSVVCYPYMEMSSPSPRGVIGMFDVSARPYVPGNVLTFAVPMIKLEKMIANMEESFLTTGSWAVVKKRIR
jgi:uncharacterized protein (DUF169 family)